MNFNTNILRNVVTFLCENEQYSNDWSVEIAEMNKLIEYIDAKNGHYYFPPYETILNTCFEDISVNDAYVVSLPLGYHIEFIRDKDDSIWAEFYDKDDNFVKWLLFWNELHTEEIRQAFEYYLDHFYDNIL